MNIFKGWQDHEKRLEKNWKKTVTQEDTVVLAGDISWGVSLDEAEKDFAFLNSLPGQKLIMKGNHDFWWGTKKKSEDFFREKGFDTLHILHNNAYKIGDTAVCGSRGWFFDGEKDKKILLREAKRLEISIEEAKKLGGEIIVFLHYPPVSVQEECTEILDVLRKYEIKKCYYGHLHSGACRNAMTGIYENIDFSLISADYLEFCPKLVRKFD